MKIKARTVLVLIIAVIIVVSISVFAFLYVKNKEKEEQLRKKVEEKELVEKIKSHYGTYVKTKKSVNLYSKEDDKYLVIGTVESGVELQLKETDITKNTEYFEIEELGFYIAYEYVEKIDSVAEKNMRYKNYIPFNENIKTKEVTKLYRNNLLIYTLNFSIDQEVIMKDEDGYYIEYFNELFYVLNEDVDNKYENNGNTEDIATEIPVTVYHFFYADDDTSCNESICHSETQIREQFNYLKENNYFTITTKEMEYFLDEKINLPKSSILVTIDDGARAENFVPLLEEYEINATLFLVSSWYSKDTFQSNYMEIASHTHNMHTPGVCSGGQGSPLKCLDKYTLVEDLKTSREILDNTEAFCFPFYEYNSYAIEVVKDAGFKTAYIGGQIKAKLKTDKYKIPRITIHKDTTLIQYINYLK